MNMVANACELQQREHAILEGRRQQQLNERRARRNERKGGQSNRTLMPPTTLSDIEAITARPGFLREQLKLANLTPLRRWHLQLKLLAAEDAKTHRIVSVADGNDDAETAMQSLENVLSRGQRCYDIVYREGARVMDARERLLEDCAPINVREVLSFSTRHESFICRITCVHDGMGIKFSSTLHMENLQPELEQLLTEERSVSAAIFLIWNSLTVLAT
ncbi:hypothetical protein GN244_ATG01929 [Phytophthora infestans]|uniref:Uncharacterized protein n=1 Tax=Phytophthora infestans TaxID=4787 RepID=A0A833WPR1_PHYIN|nr:hypothetical protein GN244_ATG01929 [Phytophthora infestans]